MRQIGTLSNEHQARKFDDYLLTLEVKSMVEEASDNWIVWIYDEDQVDQAKQELAAFAAAPDDARYSNVRATAKAFREKEIKKVKSAKKNVVDVRRQWQRPAAAQCPVTVGLIGISIVVAVFSQLGDKPEPLLSDLSIIPVKYYGTMAEWQPANMISVMTQKEVWRLITPIFIHFGWLHIMFNMMWLRELGMAIESRRGSLRFVGIVLLIAMTSNVLQFWESGRPTFGGMSGVVYGLFGYIWMKSKFDPTDSLHMPQNTVFWLMGWFFLCMTGIAGPVANTAHGVGLITGMALGYGSSQIRQLRSR